MVEIRAPTTGRGNFDRKGAPMAGRKLPKPPIAEALVVECRRLLATGLSQRTIVAQLNISKGTVWAIANGKHLLPAPKKAPRFRMLARPVRCNGCGGLLNQVPCLLCLTNRRGGRSPASSNASPHYRRPSPRLPRAPVT